MKYVLLSTSLFLLFGYSFMIPLPLKMINDIKRYLDNFYPLPTRQEQIMAMQKFFHMPLTGIISKSLIKIMELSRCGLPDVQQKPTEPIWHEKNLTYSLNNYTPDLPESKVDEIMQKALEVWSDVTPLTFSRVSGRANITIRFAYFAHGDGFAFDGPGGTLAHAFPPKQGDSHFDDSEKFSANRTGICLFQVSAHEFGHSLGLNHSDVKGALMYPTYNDNTNCDPASFRLPDDDKQRIQRLYGKP